MTTTIRTYRHSPNVTTDPTGTLVDTEVDVDDLPGSVTVDSTGWSPGSYEVTVTAQKDTQSVSARSNTWAITVSSPEITQVGGTTTYTASLASGTPISITSYTPGAGLHIVTLLCQGTFIPVETVSGGGLTWRRIVVQTRGLTDLAAMWVATGTPNGTAIQATINNATTRVQLTVRTFTGADLTLRSGLTVQGSNADTTAGTDYNGIGAIAVSYPQGIVDPAVTILPAHPNSLIIGAVWIGTTTGSVAPPVLTGTTELRSDVDAPGSSWTYMLVSRRTDLTPGTPVSVSVGHAANAYFWTGVGVAIEIRPA